MNGARIPVLLAESPAGIGGRSRYAWSVELPGPSRYPEAWIDFLDRVGACLAHPGILLPANDVLTNLVSQHADRFEPSFRFSVPRREVVAAFVPGLPGGELAGDLRPLRPGADERHLTEQHVEQLR